MLDYDLTDRAVRDMTSARRWYDNENIDLGNRFIDEVLLTIRAARERPHSFRSCRATGGRYGVERFRTGCTLKNSRAASLCSPFTIRRAIQSDGIILTGNK